MLLQLSPTIVPYLVLGWVLQGVADLRVFMLSQPKPGLLGCCFRPPEISGKFNPDAVRAAAAFEVQMQSCTRTGRVTCTAVRGVS